MREDAGGHELRGRGGDSGRRSITAHDAIVGQAGLRGGETLLVHAVGSGVGTAAIQLGRALGAYVIGARRAPPTSSRAPSSSGSTSRSKPKTRSSRTRSTRRRRAARHVVASLELVGGAYVDEDLRCIQTRGRIVLVGLALAGARGEVDLRRLMSTRARIFGTMLRSRPLEEKIAAMRAFEAQVVPLFARGKLAAVIDTVMDLDAAGAAHARMASNDGSGKIVLRC